MTEFNFYVTYKDGTREHLTPKVSYDHLDHDNIASFTVRVGKTEPITLHLEEGQHLIYRHRGLAVQGGYIDPEKLKKLELEPDIYFFGWRQNIKGIDVQAITYILDYPKNAGYVMHQAGKWDDNHHWFYKPQYSKFEVDVGEKYWDEDTKSWVIKTP